MRDKRNTGGAAAAACCKCVALARAERVGVKPTKDDGEKQVRNKAYQKPRIPCSAGTYQTVIKHLTPMRRCLLD